MLKKLIFKMAVAKLLILLLSFVVFPSVVLSVLTSYLPAPGASRDTLIEQYFSLGFTYIEILCFLLSVHGIRISLRQLKRILSGRGLRRRGQMTDYREIIGSVENELRGSGRNLGYRMMHQRLNNEYGHSVDRESVRLILKALDPEGVENRSRHKLRRRKYFAKGPNFIWHIDGYDKLKPFGFCIHGAIDGYSRRILWLEVSSTNNDPHVIAKYFVSYIRDCSGVPYIVRGDYGTENVNVAAIQRFLRRDCEDSLAGFKSFMYGRSVANQRIESWWSILRKSNSDWWIKYFKDMRDIGLYNDDDPLQIECLRFCFMDVLRKELHQVAREWNLHRIRPSTNEESPPGRPDVLYFIPEATNTRNYAVAVDEDDLDVAEQLCREASFSETFSDLATLIIETNNLSIPETAEEARSLYIALMLEINALR